MLNQTLMGSAHTHTHLCKRTHCPPTLSVFSSSSESFFVIMQMDKASEKLKTKRSGSGGGQEEEGGEDKMVLFKQGKRASRH